MPARQALYLLLSLAGLVMTWRHNLAFMRLPDATTGAFLEGVFANPASSSIGWDIAIGSFAFLVFLVAEARRLGMKHAWVYVVLTCAVAFAFAAPLFLFQRERALQNRA